MGLSKKGKPCIVRSALVAAAVSVKTTHACPRRRYVFIATTSSTLPNCENIAYKHFFISAAACRRRAGQSVRKIPFQASRGCSISGLQHVKALMSKLQCSSKLLAV